MERNSLASNQIIRKYYHLGQAAKLGSKKNISFANTVNSEVILSQRSDLRRLSKKHLLARSIMP